MRRAAADWIRDVDRKWWLRLAFVAIVVAFILLIARATMLAFAPEHKRMERAEERLFGRAPPVSKPAATAPAS